ncbi:MAG: DUF928 domain-containing protein [Cyanobacteria bacterium]|nr:DUF928 domain-containing protein [Cyanobacteriota bacterium]
MTRFPFLKSTAVTIVALSWTGLSLRAMAEPYNPPPGLGLPGPREGAGTRGCILGNPGRLSLLTPAENVGWTTAAYPRFYWYQPIAPGSVVTFSLYRAVDETASGGELVYQAQFSGPFDAGIASLQLPETLGIDPLTVGDRYYWQVSIFCDTNSDEPTQAAVGWIERQAPDADLATALATATPLEQASLYASARYWYDLLDTLAGLKMAYPDDDAIDASWRELLDSVELDPLVEAPFFAVPGDIAEPDELDRADAPPHAQPAPDTSPAVAAPTGTPDPECRYRNLCGIR